ncbi:MAG: hypothetical protein OXL39_09445 [Caldilineaceae bacterium]|nr:hypothetical protein [Caldilineaceae bacterium]
MKIEVIESSSPDPIAIYWVSNFSMLDFQQWKSSPHQTIQLSNLWENAAKLDSRDPETREPNSSERAVDCYLPDPLRIQVMSRFDETHKSSNRNFGQSEDMSGLEYEGRLVSVLKSSTILSAVITEILQNHEPHSNYNVRISDG